MTRKNGVIKKQALRIIGGTVQRKIQSDPLNGVTEINQGERSHGNLKDPLGKKPFQSLQEKDPWVRDFIIFKSVIAFTAYRSADFISE